MALITIQVIEGLERGSVYEDLPTPVSIGREDDNRIRLNDERVSRFHAKIQEDNGRIILTDLDSTNGTRCNGQPVQMRVLQPGDQLTIGRCLLVYGSREEIAARMGVEASLSGSDFGFSGDDRTFAVSPRQGSRQPGFEDDGLIPRDPLGTALFPKGAPELPTGLSAAQRAELSDVLAYVHDQIQNIIQVSAELTTPIEEEGIIADNRGDGMFLPWLGWHRLVMLEQDLATALNQVANPES